MFFIQTYRNVEHEWALFRATNTLSRKITRCSRKTSLAQNQQLRLIPSRNSTLGPVALCRASSSKSQIWYAWTTAKDHNHDAYMYVCMLQDACNSHTKQVYNLRQTLGDECTTPVSHFKWVVRFGISIPSPPPLPLLSSLSWCVCEWEGVVWNGDTMGSLR